MRSIFDDYPLFFESSVGAWPERLALRHAAIIGANKDILCGASVLDIACHDGRWSFAALKAGARHVTGIEVRPGMVQSATETLRSYGVSDASFQFVVGDLNNQTKAPLSCDVVMCLGYFYHTLNHLALFEYMASTGARNLILDGLVTPGDAHVITMYPENVFNDANGMTAAGVVDGNILVGRPTVPALKLMLHHFGYDSAVFDWPSLLSANNILADLTRPHDAENPVGDYAQGIRVTLLATKR